MPTAGFSPMVLVQANRITVLARWVAIVITTASVGVMGLTTPQPVGSLLVLLGTAALLNGAACLYLRSLKARTILLPQLELTILLYGYLITDLIFLAVAVYQSGGAQSPFVWLYVLHPALVGTVLPRRAAGAMTALAVLSLAWALGAGAAAEADGGRLFLVRLERYPVEHLVFGVASMTVAVIIAERLRRDLELAGEGWRRRALELAVLHQVVEADSSASSADEWIRQITRILASTLYPEDVGFLFVEEDGRVLRPHPSYHGIGPNPERITIPMGQGITGTVAQEGRAILSRNVQADSRFLQVAPNVAAELCVPVRVEGQIVGVLNVETRRAGALTQEDVHLMATIADHVGTVLARERVLASERAARRKAESLEHVAAVLNSTLEREELLGRVLDELNRLVPSDSTSVQLLEGETLRIVAGRGFRNPAEVIGKSLPLTEDVPNLIVIRDRRPLIVDDVHRSYTTFWDRPKEGTRSWLGVPLVSRGKVIGMIALDRYAVNTFTQSEAETALAFANHVAIALENAGRYAETLQQAMTDDLTGLYNRRYFDQELKREVVRSQRYHHPFCLVMTDLDDFKRYNDQYGHPVGDQFLKELAEVMRRVMRPTDTLTRYGGEEFALILPETDASGAMQLAERLRKAVETHRFVAPETGEPCRVTLSLGVAAYPLHATDARGLIQAADQALLWAKQTKNRAVLFGSWEEPGGQGPEDVREPSPESRV